MDKCLALMDKTMDKPLTMHGQQCCPHYGDYNGNHLISSINIYLVDKINETYRLVRVKETALG